MFSKLDFKINFMDIESSNILRVSTSNEFLLLQEYISQVQVLGCGVMW